MRYPPLPPRHAAALAAILALAVVGPASAETMRLLGAEPRPNQVMSGSGVAFALHFDHGTAARLGVQGPVGYFRVCSLTWGGCVAWMLRLVKIGVEGEGPCTDVMQVNRPDDLHDIADLGLTLAEAKWLLARVQQEIVAAQAKEHAVQRPECPRCDRACRVKDYRDHAVATLFGQVTVRLPRFCCAACGGIEAGLAWPLHCRSTPELDRLQAHLCTLMTYRTAAALLEQMFPVDAGKHHETLRRHTL